MSHITRMTYRASELRSLYVLRWANEQIAVYGDKSHIYFPSHLCLTSFWWGL